MTFFGVSNLAALATPLKRRGLAASSRRPRCLGAVAPRSLTAGLATDLARHASAAGAILNRGAHDMLGPADTALAYPTRHGYEEETRWLIWHADAMA